MNSTNATVPNGTCPKTVARSSPSLFQNGKLVLQTYHIGWIIAGCFTIVSTITSFWLINKHLQWYNHKREQRYIVRILFMVPLYALISFASFLFWNHSTPLLLVRDAYESIVLTAFFYLLLIYLSPDVEEQKLIFLKLGLSREADNEARRNRQEIKKWILPLGFVKWKPSDGLYFLQLMKWGVLQYCVIRPTTTLIAVILDYAGLFCEESWGLGWGHIYITTIVSISVTIAMYCLIQLYVPIRANLAPCKPLLKLFAIKAVVFLTFWQATLLSLLGMFGVVKDTKYMTAADINIGIGSLLETFEMMLFAFLHLRAFPYKLSQPFISSMSTDLPEHTSRLGSLCHAMDFRETFREMWSGWRYVMYKIRGKEPASDVGAKRIAYYKEAFGRSRRSGARRSKDALSKRETEPDFPVEMEIEEQVDVDIGGEKKWLGLGDSHGYGLQYFQRERSDGLEIEVEREPERYGYKPTYTPRGPVIYAQTPFDPNISTGQRRQRSWWTIIYDHISQSSQEGPGLNQPSVQSPSNSRRHRSLLSAHGHDLDDPPPPSIIRTHHNQHRSTRAPANTRDDVLAPFPILNKRQRRNLQSKQMFRISGHDSTHARDFEAAYRALEESSGSQTTTTTPMSPIRDYESGAAPERGVSLAQFGFHSAPDGLMAEVVPLPFLEHSHEMSRFSGSDSLHRREGAFPHPSFPSSSARSVTTSTPGIFSNVSNGNHGCTKSNSLQSGIGTIPHTDS